MRAGVVAPDRNIGGRDIDNPAEASDCMLDWEW